MKKLWYALVIGLVGSLAWSCSDDDYYNDFDLGYLPPDAQAFLSTFFYNDYVDDYWTEGYGENLIYVVEFDSGLEVVFDYTGNWLEVDAPGNWAIPGGIAPAAIEWFIADNFPYCGINEIKRDYWGYEVELTDGTDLMFDPNCTFIGYA